MPQNQGYALVDAGGPLQVSHNQTNTVPISPILSTLLLVAGIGLVVVGLRGKSAVV